MIVGGECVEPSRVYLWIERQVATSSQAAVDGVVCAAAGFADLFGTKEDSEILNAKKAAFLASKVMQSWVVEKIEDIIDKNKKVKHSKLSGEAAGGHTSSTCTCCTAKRSNNTEAHWLQFRHLGLTCIRIAASG